MIEELSKNIDTEISMLKEISEYSSKLAGSDTEERKILESSISSLRKSMKILNSSIPKIVQGISLAKKLPGKHETGLESINYQGDKKEVGAVLEKKDKANFLKELKISEEGFSKLKGETKKEEEEVAEGFKRAGFYVRLANKIFLNSSRNFIKRGRFKSLSLDLRKSNMDYLFESYVATTFLNTIISFFIAIVIMIFFLFFSLSLQSPFIVAYSGSYLTRLLIVFWIPIVIPILTFLISYYYPSTEKSSIERRIDQELPFAVVHMSAISGSGVEPTSIFKIIALSKEYPNLRKEIRKVLNQINLYGYDLVTALNNAARSSPSKKLSELLSGLSTTINSGGSLSGFFKKRAESLLLSYRLEREKFSKTAETFMDLYITVVIAAPMILLLIFVLLSISDFGPSISPSYVTVMIIAIIALINVVFIGILQIKQPKY